MTAPAGRARVRTGKSRLYVFALGLAVGMLGATLFAPDRRDTVEVGAGGAGAGVGPAPSTGGAVADGGVEDGGAVQVPGATTAGGGGGTGTGSVASDAGGAAPDATGEAAPGSDGTRRGITADRIRIGVGVPDLGVLAALGPNYDIGDPAEQMAALLDGWRRRGLVPVHGRDIEFTYRTYDIVGTEAQRAACEGWARDDKVFAVVAVTQFWSQPECLTVENRIPLVTSQSYQRASWERGTPYLFDLQLSVDVLFANWVHWAHERGLLAGKRIGLYYGTGVHGQAVHDALKPTLERLGYGPQIVAEVTTSEIATGSPQDSVAVQRFRAARVDLAWLLVSAINQTNFMQQAEAQIYRPAYIESDYFVSTNDTAASTFPPSQFDKSYGFTTMRFGEIRAGLGLTPAAQECVENYRRYSGRHVTYEDAPAEWMMLQQGCDEGRVVIEALYRAGPDLTVERFVDAMYQTRDVALGVHSNVSFERGVHGGATAQRTVQWHGDCRCWKAVGPFAPLYVR